MPPRRWRDGAPIQARTEEQSSGRVRVPARQKAPRSFQRCHPSRGGIQEGPRPERRDERDSRPHDESSRRHGVLETLRGGHARIVQDRAFCLCSGASAHGLSCPRKWNATCASRRERTVARRPTMRQRIEEANATGIGWCRRVAGRKPHSRARNERSSGVPARRQKGCRSRQATPRLREACLPLATGCVDGSLASGGPQGSSGVKRRR
jgi:hypothetical protein